MEIGPLKSKGSHFNFSYVCLVVASQDWRGNDIFMVHVDRYKCRYGLTSDLHHTLTMSDAEDGCEQEGQFVCVT